MVATDSYAIMSPPDSPPITQHWEGRAPQVKEGMVGKSGMSVGAPLGLSVFSMTSEKLDRLQLD